MRTAIAAPWLTSWDGVGNDALGMARTLRKHGHAVELFADHARTNEDVSPLDSLSGFGPNDTLIYHHSIQSDAGLRAVERFPGRAIVKYHNVTPPAFFNGIDTATADRAAAGLAQASKLCRAAAAVWVDSPFNAAELTELAGPGEYAAVPPFHQADALFALTPDASAAARGWGSVILCVGRVAPNKNLERAVAAFAHFRRTFDPHARLVLAGEHPFPAYSERVAASVKELHVESAVTFAGRVSVPQLKALYLTCDALLVTSDHEGFCVPVAEALGLGVPVVAVPAAAVPDTGGDVPRYAAEVEGLASELHRVIEDGADREVRLGRGRKRYDECFSAAAIERRFLDLYHHLVPRLYLGTHDA